MVASRGSCPLESVVVVVDLEAEVEREAEASGPRGMPARQCAGLTARVTLAGLRPEVAGWPLPP